MSEEESQPAKVPHRKARRPPRKFDLRSFAPLFLVVLVYVFVNLKLNKMLPSMGSSEGICSLNQQSHGNPVEDFLYRPLMQFRFGGKGSGKVQMVTISSESEPPPVLNNVCQGREFLSLLITRLANRGAKVIAIDKYFSDKSCLDGEDKKGDDDFRKALVNGSLHVVLGQSTHRKDAGKSEDVCLVADPELTLGQRDPAAVSKNDPSDKVSFGLTRLNDNSLRIPLQWWLFDDRKPPFHRRNGFALQAAEAFEAAEPNESKSPRLTERNSLNVLLANSEHPYGSFQNKIPQTPAMDVLCADPSSRFALAAKGWDKCGTDPSTKFDPSKTVVVIGQLSDQDKPSFIGGEEYGMVLQAKYISDLLGDDYVQRVPTWIDICMLFALAGMPILIDYCFPPEYAEPLRAFLALLATLVLFLLFGFVAFYEYRRFAPISFLALYGVVGALVSKAFTVVLEALKKRRTDRSLS